MHVEMLGANHGQELRASRWGRWFSLTDWTGDGNTRRGGKLPRSSSADWVELEPSEGIRCLDGSHRSGCLDFDVIWVDSGVTYGFFDGPRAVASSNATYFLYADRQAASPQT